MLKKTRSTQTGKAKVTFVLSSEPEADHVHVAGDFNDWQASTPMKRQKDGSFRATVELDSGREYQFRYLVDGNNWVNDEAADAWVPNPFGADNSVVRTPEAESSRSRAGRAATGGKAAGSSTGGKVAGTIGGGKAGSKTGGGAAGSTSKGSSGRAKASKSTMGDKADAARQDGGRMAASGSTPRSRSRSRKDQER